jgi:serine phosphatase RsbU (regulator of sigma subunit)
MIEDNELKLDDDQDESEENKLVDLIQNILEQKDRILQEHKIELTSEGLRIFESFVTNFDIYDRRKCETVNNAVKFANKRNHEQNKLVSMLVDNMRGKMDLFVHELSVAEEVQRNMIPDTNPKINGYDIRGYYHPSKHVGGDYYDYYTTSDNKLIFLIADAAGEGVPSTMVLARMQAFMFSQIQENKPLNELVGNLNQYLIETLKTETFVTMFIGKLDPASGKFEYVNAGHNAPVIFSGKNNVEELPDKGPLLGIFEVPE